MSATRREHVIQALDTPAFEGEITGGVPVPDDPADEQPSIGWCGKAAPALYVAAAVVGALFVVVFMTFLLLDGYYPAYSAAITGAAGAVAASSSNAPSPSAAVPPLSFNLTVHIKNPKRLSAYCVPSGTTAAVSYDGAAIGAGTLPTFCAGKTEEREVVVPVWAGGAGADDVAALLSALQRWKAAVDVVIQMPSGDGPHLVACSVRIGRGLSPCAPAASHYH